MRVLITGCCGFVGRAFVCRLVDDGYAVTGVDNLSAGSHPDDWAFRPKAEWQFFQRDIRNVCAQGYDFGQHDLIIHCAAVVGGRLKIEGDPLAVATDLAIDADLFNALARCRFKGKLIYFSSSAIYPVELQTRSMRCKLHEKMTDLSTRRIGMPDQTYGWSKLTGELLARHATETYGLDVVIYRPFSGYGEDQALDYPFPAIIRRVAAGENPVKIWSDSFRDFIHIDDIVEAVLSTYEYMRSAEPLNLGTGIATSFSELARMAVRFVGSSAAVEIEPNRPAGVFYRVADIYDLREMYAPKISLEEGVRRALDFYLRAT